MAPFCANINFNPTLNKFYCLCIPRTHVARVVKALSILCRGHGVEPRGGHNFVLDLLVNPVLPHGSLGLVHLMPSRRPVNCQVTSRTTTCSISIGPYVHPTSPCLYCMDATWHPHFSKFACFINTTECDNFLIRSPFEVK